MNGALSGYKTYIVAGVAIVSAVAGYLDGDLGKVTAGRMVLDALLAVTIRHGISKVGR